MAENEGMNVITQFKIVEKEYIVEVPKYVEKIIEVPKYVERKYERPVLIDKNYERPIIHETDLTAGLREIIRAEIEKGLADVIQSLKVSLEIPMTKIIQIRPKG